MKRRVCWFAGLILFNLALWPAQVTAQSGQLAWSAQARYEFGQAMHFQLTAENPDPIERATLFVRTPEFPNTLSVIKSFAPARQIVVEHDLDLTQVQLAPFAEVTFWWVLGTAAGDIALPEQTITYEDDQFEWRRLEGDGVVAHWTGDDPGLGQLALDIVHESLPGLTAIIPVDDAWTDDAWTLDMYLYPSSADLRSALRLAGRDWVGAHAHPELGVILVTAVNARTAATDLRQSIPHELVHYLLYQTSGSNYDNVPLWFNEGLATAVETQPNPNYETILETAVINQTTIPFNELCYNFPDAEDQALLAYAQSASLIQYIQARYGRGALADMVDAFAAGADCQSGVMQVLQASLTELNRDWLRQRQPRSPFAQFWLDNTLWLLLLVGGFGVASLLIILPDRKPSKV